MVEPRQPSGTERGGSVRKRERTGPEARPLLEASLALRVRAGYQVPLSGQPPGLVPSGTVQDRVTLPLSARLTV
jgi:hypothetical protein